MLNQLGAIGALWGLMVEAARTSPRKTAASAVLMLVLTFTEGAGLLLLAPLLELVGVMEQSPMPRAAGWLDRGFSAVGVEVTLGSVLLLFVALAGALTMLRWAEARLVAAAREDLASAYRNRLYRAMAAAEWRFLVTRTPAEFAHVLTSEIGRVSKAVTQVTNLGILILAAIVYLALAIRLSPSMAALVLVSAAVLAWSVRGTLNRARALGARAAGERSRLHDAVAEQVASIKTARSYGALDRHAREFAELTRMSHHAGFEVAAGDIDLQQRLELGSTLLLAAIVYVAAEIINVAPAVLLVLLFVFARLMPRLINIYRLVQELAMVAPVIESVKRLENECLAAAEPVAAAPREVALTGGIRFEDVTFTYLRRSAPAVDGLSLSIDAGVTTAIVGPSGSGKTTAADLMMGLLSPTAGRILIDGAPLTSELMSSWRAQISYVPQDAFLFDDSVRANLLWARPDVGEPELWNALALAAADEFVRALPHGLDTVIGERGVLLSGGERQRLAIARALLRRPRILLLDEATSSLDAENELRIQQAIDALQHRLTIVVITHRWATIRHADVIHVMDRGRVVESGRWPELRIHQR